MSLGNRFHGRAWLVAVLACFMGLNAHLAGAAAAGSETVSDNFDAISYSGSNGSVAWSGSWIETGESDGPTTGRVRVVSEASCAAGGCGLLTAGGTTSAAMQRQADLSGASNATLSFTYRRTRGGGRRGPSAGCHLRKRGLVMDHTRHLRPRRIGRFPGIAVLQRHELRRSEYPSAFLCRLRARRDGPVPLRHSAALPDDS